MWSTSARRSSGRRSAGAGSSTTASPARLAVRAAAVTRTGGTSRSATSTAPAGASATSCPRRSASCDHAAFAFSASTIVLSPPGYDDDARDTGGTGRATEKGDVDAFPGRPGERLLGEVVVADATEQASVGA